MPVLTCADLKLFGVGIQQRSTSTTALTRSRRLVATLCDTTQQQQTGSRPMLQVLYNHCCSCQCTPGQAYLQG
jgi:hypothetical protein